MYHVSILLMQHIPAHAEPATVERVAKMPLSSMPMCLFFFFFLSMGFYESFVSSSSSNVSFKK